MDEPDYCKATDRNYRANLLARVDRVSYRSTVEASIGGVYGEGLMHLVVSLIAGSGRRTVGVCLKSQHNVCGRPLQAFGIQRPS